MRCPQNSETRPESSPDVQVPESCLESSKSEIPRKEGFWRVMQCGSQASQRSYQKSGNPCRMYRRSKADAGDGIQGGSSTRHVSALGGIVRTFRSSVVTLDNWNIAVGSQMRTGRSKKHQFYRNREGPEGLGHTGIFDRVPGDLASQR